MAIWSFVFVFALVGVLFTVWYSKELDKAGVDAANNALQTAVTEAQGWLDDGEERRGRDIERKLESALADERVTTRAIGDSQLKAVRERLSAIAEEKQNREKQRATAALLIAAKSHIGAKQLDNARVSLRTYLDSPFADDTSEATSLFRQINIATSDTAALEMLMRMGDAAFSRFQQTGEYKRDVEVTHPRLVDVRDNNLKRNLSIAVRQREEIRKAEKAERLAKLDRQQEEQERLEREAEQARLAAEERERAKAEAADKEARLYADVLGHWVTNDGAHLYINNAAHVIVNEDKVATTYQHGAISLRVVPTSLAELTALPPDRQKEIGDLLDEWGDVKVTRLKVFGQLDVVEDVDGKWPGGRVFSFRVNHQILNREFRFQHYLVFVNGGNRDTAEWLTVIQGGNEVSIVRTVRRKDQKRTP